MSVTSAAERGALRPDTIETRTSWVVALTALGIYSVSFGAPGITVVALKQSAADLGSARSVPSLAFSLAWFGAAIGGVGLGWLAERIGIRWVVVGGAFSIALGLVLSSFGNETALLIGHGVFRSEEHTSELQSRVDIS